ncbi:MAG TPA: hypothetical protein VIP05_12345 [Burkholderiaceae bacterium]
MTGPRSPHGWTDKAAQVLASAIFVAFVVWLARGVAQGGWVLWFAIALVAAPIVGYLAFLGWIAFAFIREGKRNVRAAEQARREAQAGRARPLKPRRRRSRGNR